MGVASDNLMARYLLNAYPAHQVLKVARLKAWRILTKLRTAPARATNLLRALFVLTNLELDR